MLQVGFLIGVSCFALALGLSWYEHAAYPTAHTIFEKYRQLGVHLGVKLQY